MNYSKVYSYIMDCIEDPDTELETPKDKIDYVFIEFNRVANYPYNLQRIPNNQARLADYLMGLPFGFDFANYRILELAKEWGGLPENATKKQEDRILDNYWSFMALQLLQIKNNSPKYRKIAKEY